MSKFFKDSYMMYSVLAIISFAAGFSLLINPAEAPLWLIRGVGLIWILEGINYLMDKN